ncbi:MAG TPA: hypothetical protein DCM05_05755 [Elusimicrobia bacterium]|nr:hypothetical protein [Elusimicrobiota bacterium]
MGWYLWVLPALSGLTALLETDGVYVGQWMLSRPVVAGPLVGAALGAGFTGVAFGAVFEALSLEASPVGSFVPMNGTVGAVCAVLLCAGPEALPPAAALPAGLALGLGVSALERLLRDRRAALSQEAERSLRSARRVPWAGLLFRSVGTYALAVAAFIYLSVALLGPAVGGLWGALPSALQRGLMAAFDWSPWLASAVLMHALARGR